MLYLLPTALIPMIIYSIYPILDFHVKNPDKMLNELYLLNNFINLKKLRNLYIISWKDKNQTFAF